MREVQREVELKLEISPQDLTRLWSHPRVRALAAGRARTRTLRSVYFDTPELALARRGMGLRLRWVDGHARPIQTLKLRGAGAAGLFERGEVECGVEGDRPDLDAVPDAALRRRLQRALGGAVLDPVFETRMRRTSRLLREGRHEWSLDLDVGEACTDQGREPFCEVELELRRGDASRLYAFALELAQSITLLPDGRSKADRGYALLPHAPAPAARPTRPALRPGHRVGQALECVLRSCVEALTRDLRAAFDGAAVEPVQQLYEDVCRTCAALALFDAALPERRTRRIRAALERAAEALDAVREVDRFAGQCAASPLPRSLCALRALRLGAARELLRGRRSAHALLDLGALLAEGGGRGAARTRAVRSRAVTSFASAQLRRRHRAIRDALGKLARAPSAPRQPLRRALAELRHAVEFFRPLLHTPALNAYRCQLLRVERSLERIEAGGGADALLRRLRASAQTASVPVLEHAARRARARATRAARQLRGTRVWPDRAPSLAAR